MEYNFFSLFVQSGLLHVNCTQYVVKHFIQTSHNQWLKTLVNMELRIDHNETDAFIPNLLQTMCYGILS